MKQIFLLSIALFLITACERPPEELTLEGAAGYVSVEILDPENETPTLPSQISVNFEKPTTDNSNLKINSLDSIFTKLLYGEQPETLSFGCNEFQATELPLNIDAQKVVLCGKIKIPTNGFKMRVSHLELHNTELSATAPERADEFDQSNLPVLSIYTANLTLFGTNRLVLQGFEKGRERQIPPALFLKLAKVEGVGTFEIFTRSSIKVVNY